MMKTQYKKLFFLSILLVLICSAAAQKLPYDPEKYIEWKEHEKLSWDFFNGKPAEDAFGDAGTAVKIKAKPYVVHGEIYYSVYALFNKKKSWCKGKSEELLAHEQLHFDIAELTARKIRRAVEQLKDDNITNLKTYNKTIKKILIKSNDFDAQYDKDTFHGLVQKKQQEWQKNVSEQLSALKTYAKQEKTAEVF